LSTEC